MQKNNAQLPSSFVKEITGVIPPSSDQSNTNAEAVSLVCYENEVPSFIEPLLADLYGNIFSSLPHLEVYASTFNASTYIARKGNEVSSVLIFKIDKTEARVINEGMKLSQEEINRFARYIFDTYFQVRKIVFNAISSEIESSSFVISRFPASENIILSLPSTEEEYVAKLGKSTRKNIKHHLSRLKRSFPSFQHEVYDSEAVREEDVLAIIEFNKMRMAGKNKTSHLNEEKTARIMQLVKRCGFISLIKIDGRICAGAICYRTGLTVTSHVNAHDPQYDDYRLGTLCCYLAIGESIRRGAKEFHLLWGRYEYKYALLGVDHNFDRIFIYRSYLDFLLDSKTVLRNKLAHRLQQIKVWLAEAAKKDNRFAKFLKKSRGLLKA
jgi:hypothetical protein